MARPSLTTLLAAVAAIAATGCGEDEADEPVAGSTSTTEVVGSQRELPAGVAGDVASICGRLVTSIGSLPSPGDGDTEREEFADRVDDLQAAAIDDLTALSDRVPGAQGAAWDAYLAAQEEAFALSPPPTVGEPQPELDAANAAAEAQAAELGFPSCSSV